MRAFLAVYPDGVARAKLAEIVPDDTDGVRPLDMADWHVTVRFLGELDDAVVSAIGDASALACERLAPFLVRLGPMTALGTSARVLFVPANGIDHLAAAVDDAIVGLAPPRDWPFRGHLTLARARGRSRLPGSLPGRPISTAFEVAEMALVASSLEPDQAVHRVVRRFPFGGR